MANLLVIEDEAALARNIARYFEQRGHVVEVAHDGETGLDAARRLLPEVAIVDYQLPGMDGLDVIRALRDIDAQVRPIMVSGHASVAVAVDAMKAGSFDLLTKPVPLASLQAVVDRALLESGHRKALAYYQRREADAAGLDQLVGESMGLQTLRARVRTIADIEPGDGTAAPPVLVSGETGTGKKLVARACHFASPRSAAPFVDVNCAALSADQMDAELFGCEKGAFPDAHERKVGLIEAADGGTLFLDEVGELDPALQAKLLGVLETGKVRRLGSVTDRHVNVRIVAATRLDLDARVAQGQFRGDLLHRLRVLQIDIPPLRERGDDVWRLAQHFAAQFAQHYRKPVPTLDASAEASLHQHGWPGNVRELRNLIERTVLLNQGAVITSSDLLLTVIPQPLFTEDIPERPALARLEAVEREHLERALEQTGWNVTRAARRLDISRDTLRYRMDKHSLVRPPEFARQATADNGRGPAPGTRGPH